MAFTWYIAAHGAGSAVEHEMTCDCWRLNLIYQMGLLFTRVYEKKWNSFTRWGQRRAVLVMIYDEDEKQWKVSPKKREDILF